MHSTWDAPRAALIDAMLIGDTASIQRDTRLQFQRTGVYHILVVSGMNVGILAVVIFWVLRRLRVSDVLSSPLTVAMSIGYAYLADLGAPILRAVFMLAVYLGARLLYRDRAALNAVGTAALVLLALDPRSLFDPSFQLTFGAVLAIAGIGVPLLRRTSRPPTAALCADWMKPTAISISRPARHSSAWTCACCASGWQSSPERGWRTGW